MAHNLTIRADGMVEFGFAGKPAWHGLGQELSIGAPIEEWIVQAGLDWTIESSPILYSDSMGIPTLFPNRVALFRSDNGAPLSVVSDGYKVVQPREVLEFFRTLTEDNGMQLTAAGSLFGGTRFWATATMGVMEEIVDGDIAESNLLLVTGADGKLATVGKQVATRVVCNNTLNIALNEKSKNMVKVSHLAPFDPEKTKLDLGLIDASWAKFITDMRALANVKMSAKGVESFITSLFDTNQEVNKKDSSKVEDIYNLYFTGAGADVGVGTAWGALNAVTNYYTHEQGRRSDASHLWSNLFGDADKMKNKAKERLLAMV